VSVLAPALPFAPLLHLRDETFDPGRPAAYNLYLTAGPAGTRLVATDVARQKVVLLEDAPAAPLVALPAQFAAHELLGQAGWAQVRMALTGRAFTLLPAPLFRAGDEEIALRLHHQLISTETTRHFVHPNLDLVNVFAADAELASWLSATHGPQSCLLHHTSALLAGLLHQRGPAAPRQLYLHLGQQELTLVLLQQQRLEFCNVFPYGSAEDVLYYTILVMQELGLNPDQDELTIWGDLTSDSALFELLRTYIRRLRFGSRPYDLQYSYRLNEVLEYQYFDLLSLHFIN
jgi:hypothetical protein